MKKLIIVAVAVLSISACSTNPNAMRSNLPDQVHFSLKSAKEVSICIANKWESLEIVNSRETTNGYSVSGQINGRLHYLADIENKDAGSVTKVYKFMAISVGSDPFFDAVEICQY